MSGKTLMVETVFGNIYFAESYEENGSKLHLRCLNWSESRMQGTFDVVVDRSEIKSIEEMADEQRQL